MFLWNVHHFQKFKQQFHCFKVSHNTTLIQKPKNCNKLYKLLLFSPQPHPHNNHVNHYVFSPTTKEPFILCMLWFNRHVILPHIAIWFCNLTFAPPNMPLEVVKFGNQQLFFVFNLWANMTHDHVHFPIWPKHNFCPWKFCYPKILKNLINFSFPHLFCFSSLGLVLNTSPHFATTFFAPTSTSCVVHLDALQTTPPPPPPPSFESQTSMTLGMLTEEKNL